MATGVLQQEPWNTNPQGFPTFPCGNSSPVHKRTTNSMMEQKGFGLGIALARLKAVPALPACSHPQHPFLFPILSWWHLCTHFLKSFSSLFLNLKTTKPSELYSLKIPFIWFISTISIFFKETFRPVSNSQWSLVDLWMKFLISWTEALSHGLTHK